MLAQVMQVARMAQEQPTPIYMYCCGAIAFVILAVTLTKIMGGGDD